MKKLKCAFLTVISIASIGILTNHFYDKSIAETIPKSQIIGSDTYIPENYTIRLFLDSWKGTSKAEIDQYFAEWPRDTKIIAVADKNGDLDGYMSMMEGYPIEADSELNSDEASTIGEVLDVLYQYAQ